MYDILGYLWRDMNHNIITYEINITHQFLDLQASVRCPVVLI